MSNTMVVCTYHNRGMSSLCFGSQHSTEADWMCGFELCITSDGGIFHLTLR